MKEKIESNTKFCHFTSSENARNILSGECFYLSKFNNMNDLAEAKLHSDEKDKVFSLSFCNSESLNIPLFYLYGGIDGKGFRLQFTASKINEILSNCSVHYVNKNNIRLKKEISHSQYTIDCDWIYYITSNGFCEYKDTLKTNYDSFDCAFQSLKKKDKHFYIKNKIWKFEKEFRIIVKFNEDIPYDKVALVFNIKENEKGISIVCGPEYTEAEIKKIKEEFSGYGISNVSPSSVNAISMKLCQKNNIRR